MFGIGISELVVIFLVALLVLGPEQLPKVARTLAKVVGEFRRYSDDLRLNIMDPTSDFEIKKTEVAKKPDVQNLPAKTEVIARGDIVEPPKDKPESELHG